MGFGKKLSLIFILIGFIPLFIGGVYLFYYFDGYLRSSVYGNLNRISDITVAQVEQFINKTTESVLLLGKNEILVSGDYSVEEVEEEIVKIKQYFQELYADITILDAEGRTIISTGKTFYGRWEVNPWFLEARQQKRMVVSDMYAVNDPEKPIMTIILPIVDAQNKLELFIIVHANTEPLFTDLDFKIGERGKIILVNKMGDIIFHPEKENIFTKISKEYPLQENAEKGTGNLEFVFFEEDVVSSFRVVEKDRFNLEWHLIALMPKEEAFGFLQSMTRGYMGVVFLLFFLIILFSFLISRKTLKPLKNLSLVSKQIAKGDFNARANIYSRDEFGELAENFNRMTKDLEKSRKMIEEERDILEIRVAARTRELNEIANKLEKEVEARTKELQKKLADMEKLNRLMVGRELKMIELKKELNKIKEVPEE